MSAADTWQQFSASVTWDDGIETPGSDYDRKIKSKLFFWHPKIMLHFNQACKKEKINLASQKGVKKDCRRRFSFTATPVSSSNKLWSDQRAKIQFASLPTQSRADMKRRVEKLQLFP